MILSFSYDIIISMFPMKVKFWMKECEMDLIEERNFRKKLLELVLPIAFQQFMLALVSASDAIMLGFVDQTLLSAFARGCRFLPALRGIADLSLHHEEQRPCKNEYDRKLLFGRDQYRIERRHYIRSARDPCFARGRRGGRNGHCPLDRNALSGAPFVETRTL